MSIGERAARGAIWSVGASIGARALGLIGTLYMTRLLAPEVVGEVAAAAVLAQTASWLTHWGFNQYMIVHGPAGAEQTYHCAVINLVLALLGIGAVAATGSLFAPVFNAPHLAAFLPGMALSVLIRRAGAVADKILVREMKFRELAIANGAGEILFTITAVALAATTDLGGHSIVIGNVLQAAVTTALILRATGMGWLERTPWRWERVREIVRYGAPLGVAQVFNFATRYWDNLAFSAYFGSRVVGHYNMAYNLADIPAVQVGEQLTSVLLPAMSNLGPEERKAAVVRSTALMALAVFPLATGLGAIAPTLIDLLLNDEWQGVAPLLTVLSVLSVVRPMAWGITTYLASHSRTRTIMVLEAFKLVLLFGCIVALAPLGPHWTAGAVGIAFGVQALAAMALVVRTDGIPAAPLIGGFLRPLAACGVMVAAVIGAREGLVELGVTAPVALLPVEIGVGVVSYIAAALVLAPATSHDFLRQLRRALKR
jgi:PST family polysaccharide transporter